MAPSILSTMLRHLCLYLTYLWNKVNFSSAVITFDRLYMPLNLSTSPQCPSKEVYSSPTLQHQQHLHWILWSCYSSALKVPKTCVHMLLFTRSHILASPEQDGNACLIEILMSFQCWFPDIGWNQVEMGLASWHWLKSAWNGVGILTFVKIRLKWGWYPDLG